MDVELFVLTLTTRRLRYVATRWLIQRADLYYDNHLEQIAVELGISAPAVAKVKKRIRAAFKAWW
jgi:hypothetical protein